MAQEFNTLLDEFAKYGSNWCANAKKVTPHLELKRVVDIYATGAQKAISSTSAMLRSRYDAMPDDLKQELDQTIASSGAIEMLQAANSFIGPNSGETKEAVSEAGKLFHKVKTIIKEVFSIEAGGTLDKALGWIDMFLDNIDGILKLAPLLLGA